MRHKWKLVVVLVSVAVFAGAFILLKPTDNKDAVQGSTTKALSDETTGLTVAKEASMVEQSVNEGNKKAGQLWQLRQPEDSQHVFEVTAAYEQGASLSKLTAVTRKPLRDSVVDNINIQLRKQYPEYKQVTQRNLTVNSLEANETIFEYVSQGVKVKQRLLLIIKNSDTAVYIRGQAKAAEYDEVDSKYFEPLFNSAKFQ